MVKAKAGGKCHWSTVVYSKGQAEMPSPLLSIFSLIDCNHRIAPDSTDQIITPSIAVWVCEENEVGVDKANVLCVNS